MGESLESLPVESTSGLARAAAPPACELPLWSPLLPALLLMLYSFTHTANWTEHSRIVLGFYAAYSGLLASWYGVLRYQRRSFRGLLGQWPSRQQIKLLLLLTFASLGARVGWWSIMEYTGCLQKLQAGEPVPDSVASSLAFFVFAILPGPIVEEVLFRGVISSRLARWVGGVGAIAISSVLFSVMHVDMAGSFVFALVMAALFARTGTLWVPIMAHCVSNFLSLGLDHVRLLEPVVTDVRVGVALLVMCLPPVVWFAWSEFRKLRVQAISNNVD